MTDWIFQANPKRYDVHAAVKRSPDDSWNTPRSRDSIAIGDRVWLSIVGPSNPGLYYVAEATSLPYETPDSEFGRWHTDIRYIHRIDPPLSRSELLADPIVNQCRLLGGFQGSNAIIPEDIAARLRDLASDRFKSVRGEPDPASQGQLDANKAIERHNRSVHQQLKAAIAALDPTHFELLVVKVLTALGYDVKHTGQTNDGGVDANAVLSLGGLTSVMTRVQAKRWGNSVPGRVVRELRGALKVDERGLIVTTAEFTPEAKREAEADGKARIGLLSGEALAQLCAEHGIGVERRQITLLKLQPGDLSAEE